MWSSWRERDVPGTLAIVALFSLCFTVQLTFCRLLLRTARRFIRLADTFYTWAFSTPPTSSSLFPTLFDIFPEIPIRLSTFCVKLACGLWRYRYQNFNMRMGPRSVRMHSYTKQKFVYNQNLDEEFWNRKKFDCRCNDAINSALTYTWTK